MASIDTIYKHNIGITPINEDKFMEWCESVIREISEKPNPARIEDLSKQVMNKKGNWRTSSSTTFKRFDEESNNLPGSLESIRRYLSNKPMKPRKINDVTSRLYNCEIEIASYSTSIVFDVQYCYPDYKEPEPETCNII